MNAVVILAVILFALIVLVAYVHVTTCNDKLCINYKNQFGLFFCFTNKHKTAITNAQAQQGKNTMQKQTQQKGHNMQQFIVWEENSSGAQMFSDFATNEEATRFANEVGGEVILASSLNADETVLLTWMLATQYGSEGGFATSYDAFTDRDDIKHLKLNTRKLKHFKLCALSNSLL